MLKQTYEEIMEEVANVSWALMDAEQHATVATHIKTKFIGKTSSDGIQLTWNQFGRSLGTTGNALELAGRRAQGGSSRRADSLTDTEASTVRSALSIARKNPAAAHKIAEAIEVVEAVNERKAKRALGQPSERERKEMQAQGRAIAEPVLGSAADLAVSAIAEVIAEAAEDLGALGGRPGKRAVNRLRKSYDALTIEVEVLEGTQELEDA